MSCTRATSPRCAPARASPHGTLPCTSTPAGKGCARRHRQRTTSPAATPSGGPHLQLPRAVGRHHPLQPARRPREAARLSLGQSPTGRTTNSASTTCADNMKLSPDRMVQRHAQYALVDEVDLHPHRTRRRTPSSYRARRGVGRPLLQGQPAHPAPQERRRLTVDEKAHSAMLSRQGVDRIERCLGIKNPTTQNTSTSTTTCSRRAREQPYKRDVALRRRGRQQVVIIERAHRPQDAGPPLVRRAPPGHRGQGARGHRGRTRRSPRSPSRTTSACTRSSPA